MLHKSGLSDDPIREAIYCRKMLQRLEVFRSFKMVTNNLSSSRPWNLHRYLGRDAKMSGNPDQVTRQYVSKPETFVKKNHYKIFMKNCFSCCKVITKWSPKRNSLFLFKIYTLIVDNFLFWLSEHWEFYILSVDNLSNNFNLIIRILRIFWFNFASNLIKIKT